MRPAATIRIMPPRFSVPLLCVALLGGCIAEPDVVLRPATIHHLVFVGLQDPADAPALIADSDALLATIPSVTYYFCGPHHDFGRSNIDADYDVALGVGFDDDEGYQVYLDHENHVEFVRRWRPRSAWLRIHDVHDQNRTSP